MAFGYQKILTIDHTKCGSSDTTNFPLVFNSTVAHFKTVANGGRVQNSSGYDIVFFSDASLVNKLDFELRKYDATTGLVVAYIRIPTLTHSTDKVIYIGYGDSTISTFQGNATGAWASTFKLVMHGGDGTTISIADSTSNANVFTNSNATATTGQILGAMHFNGTNAKVTKSGLVIPTSAGTFYAWWKPNSAGSTNRYGFRSYNASPLRLFDFGPYSDGHEYCGWYNNGNDKRTSWTESGISSGTWYRAVITWTNGGDTVHLMNAAQKAVVSSLNATWDTSGVTTALGWDEQAPSFSNIDLEDVWLTDTATSADQITADYNNQISPATFYSLTDGTAFTPGQYFPPVF